MGTYYNGIRGKRPKRIKVVRWEVLDASFPTHWRVTLACGHVRNAEQGYECQPGQYGAVEISGKFYIMPPRALNCAECAPPSE